MFSFLLNKLSEDRSPDTQEHYTSFIMLNDISPNLVRSTDYSDSLANLHYLISPIIPYLLFALSSLFFIYIFLFKHRHALSNILIYGFALIIFAVSYIDIDEGIINLTHAYNFYQMGDFSFFQDKRVGGTVELLYVFLLIPFGKNHTSIIYGQMLVHFVLSIGGVYFFQKIIRRETYNSSNYIRKSCTALIIMALTMLYMYFSLEISGGIFGTSLVVIGFLSIVYGFIIKTDNNYKFNNLFLLITFIFCFTRPDNIVWLALIILSYYFVTKEAAWKDFVAGLLGTVCFFCIYKIYYGLWVPSPALFKGGSPILPDVLWAKFSLKYGAWWFICFLSLLIFALEYRWGRLLIKWPKSYQFLLYTSIGSITLGSLIFLKDTSVTYAAFRYLLPSIFVVLIVYTLFLIRVIMYFENNISIGMKIITFVAPMSILPSIASARHLQDHSLNLNTLNSTGRYNISNIFPKNWLLASSEVASLFFFRDFKNCIELWGYSTPFIANSKCYLVDQDSSITKINLKSIEEYVPDAIFFGETIRNNSISELWGAKGLTYVAHNSSYFHSNYIPFGLNFTGWDISIYIAIHRDKVESFMNQMVNWGYQELTIKKVKLDNDCLRLEGECR